MNREAVENKQVAPGLIDPQTNSGAFETTTSMVFETFGALAM